MNFHRTIPSTAPLARELVSEALKFLSEAQAAGHAAGVTTFNFRLVLDEALENALHHGNGCDAQKRITVTVRACKRKAVISVKDEGAGFRTEDMAAPQPAENRRKPHGRRGVFVEAAVCRAVTSPPSPLP